MCVVTYDLSLLSELSLLNEPCELGVLSELSGQSELSILSGLSDLRELGAVKLANVCIIYCFLCLPHQTFLTYSNAFEAVFAIPKLH